MLQVAELVIWVGITLISAARTAKTVHYGSAEDAIRAFRKAYPDDRDELA
jgi:hypothetical protein